MASFEFADPLAADQHEKTISASMIKISSRLFSWRQIALYSLAFLGVTVLYQRSQRYVCQTVVEFDCPYYWPISIFNLRMPSVRDMIVACVMIGIFYLLIRALATTKFGVTGVLVSGILLISGVTLIHGIDVGFYAPVAGNGQTEVLVPNSIEGQEYYHDAIQIKDPVDFLRHFNTIQPELHPHGHTHPPGAVLTFYYLNQVLHDPALIAVALMLMSTLLMVYFFRRLLDGQVSDETASYMTFLIVLLPVVEIYYLATIDALIAGLLTGTLYLFCFGKRTRSVIAAGAMLTASFFLTFISLFILPVLMGFDLIVKRSIKRSAIIIMLVVGAHLLLYALSGYNAIEAFRTASAFENASGFQLITDPVNYFFTRIEDVAEIFFFLGPFLLILFVKGIRDIRQRPLITLTLLGCGTLAAMFLSGAFRTGETARACAFLYPYLLFPVAYYLDDSNAGEGERWQLAALVFLQTVGMQTLGNYHW